MEDHPAKRRKIRKGTRSCWECKRRKIRCSLGDKEEGEQTGGLGGSPPCLGCRQRGTPCAGQEQPEPEKKRQEERQALVEKIATLIEQYGAQTSTVSTVSTTSLEALLPSEVRRYQDANAVLEAAQRPNQSFASTQHSLGLGQPCSHIQRGPRLNETTSDQQIHALDENSLIDSSSYSTCSGTLRRALPSPVDLSMIHELNDQITTCLHHMLLVPYQGSGFQKFSLKRLTEVVQDGSADFVATAKSLFILAISFQNYRVVSTSHRHTALPFSETPQSIISRLVEVASSLITDDDVVSTADGLECLMLRAVFLAYDGRLKPAIVTLRRAIVIGQLLGAHLVYESSHTVDDPSQRLAFVWHRLNYFEMLLCLVLGLPQGAPSAMKSLTEDLAARDLHPMEELKYRHCNIISQILQRNQSQYSLADAELTRRIDLELQEAARRMPSDWWTQPTLAEIQQDGAACSLEVARLTSQFFHYYLVTILHFPQMIPGVITPDSDGGKKARSECVCAGSAREVLTRFDTCRSVETLGYPCGAADYFALSSCTVLLLAHIGSHYVHDEEAETGSQLAHQRLSDRSLASRTLERFSQGLTCRNTYQEQGDEVRELLRAEEIVDSACFEARRSQGSDHRPKDKDHEECQSRPIHRLHHHLFGTLSIMRSGEILHEAPRKQKPPVSPSRRPGTSRPVTANQHRPAGVLWSEESQGRHSRPTTRSSVEQASFDIIPELTETVNPADINLPKHLTDDVNSFFFATDF